MPLLQAFKKSQHHNFHLQALPESLIFISSPTFTTIHPFKAHQLRPTSYSTRQANFIHIMLRHQDGHHQRTIPGAGRCRINTITFLILCFIGEWSDIVLKAYSPCTTSYFSGRLPGLYSQSFYIGNKALDTRSGSFS